MACSPDAAEIPHRVVEHDQKIRIAVEHRENVAKLFFFWVCGVSLELRQNGLGARAGQIVETQMECCISKGNAPFQRNWNRCHFSHGSQRQRGFDVVVIRKGDHACQSKPSLDLIAFELKSGHWRKRGSPICPEQVHGDRGFLLRLSILRCESHPQERIARGVLRNKGKAFLGTIRMTVQ